MSRPNARPSALGHAPLVLICLAVASQFGCAFVPKTNHRLEDAKAGFQRLSALPGCHSLAQELATLILTSSAR